MFEVIAYLYNKHKLYSDEVFILQPTSPLRVMEDLADAEKCLNDKDSLVMSVSQIDKKFNKIFYHDGEKVLPLNEERVFLNRQQLPDIYIPNGSVFFFKTEGFHLKKDFSDFNLVTYVSSALSDIDIDTEQDFVKAKEIFKKQI